MKKEIIELEIGECYEVFAREGAGGGSPAVKVEYGVSAGSDLGMHNFADAFAVAQVGVLDGDGNFVPDEWTEEDFANGKIASRRLLGAPKTYECWNPDPDDGYENNWDEYFIWVKTYCESVL